MAYSPPASSSPTTHPETEAESNRPSASAGAYPTTNYQVFINHRGPDVKKTFASNLYHSLISHELNVFLDRQEMQAGENITAQVEGAILSASVHIAIFSPRYAESKWCLDELVLMKESGRTIIPVFHHVKPSELKCTRPENGLYAKALHDLETQKTDEKKRRYNSDTIDKWRNALLHVAGISGFELEACNGDEGELLDKVVMRVLEKVKKTSFKVAKYPYGMDERVKDFENTVLQQQRSEKSLVVGIIGMRGVGKTTLAKEFFNRNSSDYTKSCFLSNKNRDVKYLQKRLLKKLTGSDLGIDNIDAAIEKLKKKHANFHAFVILDDADDADQVDAVLDFQTFLSSGSLILITSTDRDVLTRSGVENSSIYKLSGLNLQHSRELFYSHAFEHSHPLPRFKSLVDDLLKVCDGLPLSLEVFGSLLRGRGVDEGFWEERLDRLQQRLPRKIKDRLRISFDGLDPDEKEIFLDIASFFIGEKRDMAIRIWNGSDWKGSLMFQNLQNKSLVEVDSEDKIKMHNHLRDMGREILADSGLGYSLCRLTENIDDLLQILQNDKAISKVRGIRTGIRTARDNGSIEVRGIRTARESCNSLQLLDVEGDDLVRISRRLHSPNLIWLRWRNGSRSSLSDSVPMENLKNLRVLQVLNGVLKKLWKNKSQAPSQLRELVIDSPLSELPKSIGQLEHLELIILKCPPTGQLKTLPEEFCQLKSLKRFELTNCSKIKSLPVSFGSLTSLEHIDLSGSKKLKRLPDSIGFLKSLKLFKLTNCSQIKSLPDSFRNLTTLEHIDCPFLEMVPSPLCGNLKELKLRNGNNCEQLKCLPISTELLNHLIKLTVNECVFKKDEGETGTSRLSNLSSSIDMSKLLQLQHLELYKTVISEVSFAEAFCPNLQHLLIKSCNNLEKIGTLPNSLIKLELNSCSGLEKIEGLYGLAKLQMLNTKWCTELKELSSIETLVSLEVLDVSECKKLKRIEGLAQLTKLRRLNIGECSNLEELPGIEHLMSLKWVGAFGCSKLQWGEGVEERLRQRPELEFHH